MRRRKSELSHAPRPLVGTVHHMAPEQTRGGKFATKASDQWALGVMIYECATGERPFMARGSTN